MEFLLYLSPLGQQLIRDLISAKFHIHENVALCSNPQIFGYTTNPNKFIICTNNIKNGGYDVSFYVNETVYHEAIHAAQMCNNGKPLGFKKNSMNLSSQKLQNVQLSMKIVNDFNISQREHEAYYFEDKPYQVRQNVRKFCF